MGSAKVFPILLLAVGMNVGTGYAQQVISAQSGTVHYVEGSVSVNGKPVQRRTGQFTTLGSGQELRTEEGRAEVLLTPGAYLRVADHSAVRLLSNRLTDTRIEVLQGSVMVECDELLRDNAVTLVYKDRTIQLQKNGLYRIDTDPPRVKVYDGVAILQSSLGQLTLRKGKQASLDGVLLAEHFDTNAKRQDELYSWSMVRAGQLVAANHSATNTLLGNGTAWRSSGWLFDPYLDGFAFVPGGSILRTPFGWRLYSPFGLGYNYVYTIYPNSNTGCGSANGTSTATVTAHRNMPIPDTGNGRWVQRPTFTGNPNYGGYAGYSGGSANGLGNSSPSSASSSAPVSAPLSSPPPAVSAPVSVSPVPSRR